ncbi:hypothetical protein Ancab_028181 [Ancistrocladus abbreviatus]
MDSNWFPNSLIRGDSFPRLQVLSVDEVTVQSWEIKEGASPGLDHLLFDKCSFDGDLPYNALAALACLKSIRVKGPMGRHLRSLATLEGMVRNKCSIVIIPEQWRDFLPNLGDA